MEDATGFGALGAWRWPSHGHTQGQRRVLPAAPRVPVHRATRRTRPRRGLSSERLFNVNARQPRHCAGFATRHHRRLLRDGEADSPATPRAEFQQPPGVPADTSEDA